MVGGGAELSAISRLHRAARAAIDREAFGAADVEPSLGKLRQRPIHFTSYVFEIIM
jgi:hypothetical protein